MNGWAALAAFGGFITGLGGLIVAWRTSRASARKDEVEALRGIIAELRAELKNVKAELAEWKVKYFSLCDWCKAHGLEPPG